MVIRLCVCIQVVVHGVRVEDLDEISTSEVSSTHAVALNIDSFGSDSLEVPLQCGNRRYAGPLKLLKKSTYGVTATLQHENDDKTVVAKFDRRPSDHNVQRECKILQHLENQGVPGVLRCESECTGKLAGENKPVIITAPFIHGPREGSDAMSITEILKDDSPQQRTAAASAILSTGFAMLANGVANVDQGHNILYSPDGKPLFIDVGLAVHISHDLLFQPYEPPGGVCEILDYYINPCFNDAEDNVITAPQHIIAVFLNQLWRKVYDVPLQWGAILTLWQSAWSGAQAHHPQGDFSRPNSINLQGTRLYSEASKWFMSAAVLFSLNPVDSSLDRHIAVLGTHFRDVCSNHESNSKSRLCVIGKDLCRIAYNRAKWLQGVPPSAVGKLATACGLSSEEHGNFVRFKAGWESAVGTWLRSASSTDCAPVLDNGVLVREAIEEHSLTPEFETSSQALERFVNKGVSDIPPEAKATALEKVQQCSLSLAVPQKDKTKFTAMWIKLRSWDYVMESVLETWLAVSSELFDDCSSMDFQIDPMPMPETPNLQKLFESLKPLLWKDKVHIRKSKDKLLERAQQCSQRPFVAKGTRATFAELWAKIEPSKGWKSVVESLVDEWIKAADCDGGFADPTFPGRSLVLKDLLTHCKSVADCRVPSISLHKANNCQEQRENEERIKIAALMSELPKAL